MVRHFFPILFIFSFFSPSLFAQNGYYLSLKDCLDRARKSSFRLEEQHQQTVLAQSIYYEERSRSFPQVFADIGQNQFLLVPYNFRQQWTLLTADWPLGDWLLKTSSFTQNQALAAEMLEDQTRINVDRRVILLYVGILQKQVQLDLLDKKLELLKMHREVSHALWEAGTRTQLDLLQTESEITLLNEQSTRIEMAKDNLLQELARLIEWPDFQSLRIQPLQLHQIINQASHTITKEVLAGNPLLQSLDFQIKGQRLHLRSVRASQLPHLTLTGGYTADADPTGDGNYWVIGAGINFPLFRWGVAKHQREQAQAELHALEFEKNAMEREIRIQLEQIMQRMKRLGDIQDLQKKRLDITQKAFQYAEVNYTAGLISNLEYLTAEEQLMETQIAIQETLLDYAMNLIDYYAVSNQMENLMIPEVE